MKIKDAIGQINFISNRRATAALLRKFSLSAGALLRGPAEASLGRISALQEIEAFVEAEVASWLEPEDIASGSTGAFDACDLRHWLAFAKAADVPLIPARQILTLTEAELVAIDQKLELPSHVEKSIMRGIKK